MGGEKVRLTEETATLLGTLYGRALDARSENPVLGDAVAGDLVRRIDYDFRRLGVGKDDAVGVAMRARHLDRWTAAFIDRHPVATVLHLGCGLDSREIRVGPPPTVHWFEVDYPGVIDLRRRLFADRPSTRLIGSSVTDEGWLGEVPGEAPAIIVAEGLLMYLSEEGVRQLLDRLVSRFPGGELVCDVLSPLGLRLQQRNPMLTTTGASLGWAVEHPGELEAWPAGLELVTMLTQGDWTDAAGRARFSLARRVQLAIVHRIPPLRRLSWLVRYRF